MDFGVMISCHFTRTVSHLDNNSINSVVQISTA